MALVRAGRDLSPSISPSSACIMTSSMLKRKDFFFGFLYMLHAYLQVKEKNNMMALIYIPKYHNKVGFGSICTPVFPHYRVAYTLPIMDSHIIH